MVEDDKQLASALRRGLEAEGYAVDVALTGSDGEWFAIENQARPAVERALDQLLDLIRRIEQTGGLAGRAVEAATWQFDCLCEGLVIADLRSNARTDGDSTLIWADALTALVVGWRSTGHQLSSVSAPRYDWLPQP